MSCGADKQREEEVWRDLTDPRRAEYTEDLEAGLRDPEFENLVIPERFGPVRERIDDYKIKRFAFELDDYLPWAMEKGSSPFWGRRVAHPALLTNDLVQLFTLAYRASRVIGLHTQAQMWFDSPAYLDEVVTLEGAYQDAYVRRGQGYVELEARATGADGRSIVRYQGVEIMKTVPGDVAGRGSAKPEKRVTGEIPPGARTVDRIDREDVRVGDVLRPQSKCLTAEQAAVFSRVGEFVINIHNNLAQARKGNLTIPIVQGAQHFCAFPQLLTRAFGADFFTAGWVKVKFLSPIKVFEPFETTGLVTGIEPQPDGRKKVLLDVWNRKTTDGKMAAAGWASCVI